MNNLSTEQRNQIVLIAIGTLAVGALLWFSLIGALRTQLADQANKTAIAQSGLNLIRAGIAKEQQFRQEAESGKRELGDLEKKMADGDLYRWVINFLRDIESRHDVAIADFGPPQIVEFGVPPRVAYKAASYSISGTAYYADFGSFVADLENSSPFVRVKSLSLQAVAPGYAASSASEKLTFRLEFLTLIKSLPPQP
jgi:Tfp pilus assembly protein PilO